MVRIKDVADVIKSMGWQIAQGASFRWLSDKDVLVTQTSEFGFSAFRLEFNEAGNLIFFKALRREAIEDNPLVAVVLRFQDGSALRQVFTPPVEQVKAMAALGLMVARLGGELSIEPVLE